MAYVNQNGQVRIGVRGWVPVFGPEDPGTPNTIDQDSTNFILASGISDSVQTSAIETLVSDLKAYGLWTKMKAIYPFVGGTASSHKFNLKDPRDLNAAYRLVFNGGWVHSSNGAKPNGTTGYADTFLIPSTSLTNNSSHLSYYSRTNRGLKNSYAIGSYQGSPTHNNMDLRFYGYGYNNGVNKTSSAQYDGWTGQDYADYTPTTTTCFVIASKTAVNLNKIYENGILKGSNTNTSLKSLPNVRTLIGAESNGPSGVIGYDNLESAFATIGDGLSDTDASNFYISVQKFQTTLGRHVGTPYVSDPDAIAFLMAAGITDGTQAAAINTLVIRMKADGVWTKMKAVYPFVGGTAFSHKFNLKDPRDLDAAYRLVFTGGWTHTSTGALPNGTTGYADTKLSPSSVLTINSTHFSFYSRTNNAQNGADMGSGLVAPVMAMRIKYSDNNGYFDAYSYPNGRITINMTSINSTNLFIHSRTSTNIAKVYRLGIQIGGGSVQQGSSSLPSGNVFISSTNDSVAKHFSNRESSFASIGDGLTDAEAANLYSAVQAYQTTLGRQTDVPLVSDTDAQSFLNVANITSFQQASAVNKLVVDLKAAGVWSKMKAIYPFVGGSAASHKFNLKDPRDLDAAYRLVFNGGWTHTGTGALPNGTTGYADTKMNANSTNFDYQSMSATFYSRTNNSLSVNDIGVQTGSSKRFIELNIKEGNLSYMALSHQGISYLNFTNNDSRGFYHSNRIDSNTIKLYKNGTNVATGTQTSTNIYGEYSVYISALNARHNNNQVLYFSNREVSFTTLGSGLTDAEATSLYNAVQTYQTALGRAVDTPVYNNGLVLNLDAGNANSYPGTGTTWFDLASGNNGTLVNGPTYDTINGGSLLFDGINDYVDLGSNFKFVDKDLTLDFWVKCTDNSLSNWHDIIVMSTPDQSSTIGLFKSRSGSSANGSIQFSFIGNHLYSTLIGTQIVSAGIINLTGVIKKESGLYKLYLYVNGVLDKSLNTTISSYDMNTFTNFFARIGSGGPTYPEIWQGNIYSGKVWSRALSATEILNNFNSTRGRFGL